MYLGSSYTQKYNINFWAIFLDHVMIFSIAMDADYTFYVKSIETHVRAFLPLNISAVSSVACLLIMIFKLNFSHFLALGRIFDREQCLQIPCDVIILGNSNILQNTHK